MNESQVHFDKPALATPRKIEPPFCWQSKIALRRIRESFDATNTVQSALAVYVALTEIASDEESESFQSTHAWIAQRSGSSPRTVCSRLKELAEIGLVKIETPALRAPSKFTILRVSQPLRDVTQRTKKAPVRTSEENNEERNEERNEENPNKGGSKFPNLDQNKTANKSRSFIPA